MDRTISHIPRAAYAGNFCAERRGDLHGERTHTSRGTVNQNRLSWLNAPLARSACSAVNAAIGTEAACSNVMLQGFDGQCRLRRGSASATSSRCRRPGRDHVVARYGEANVAFLQNLRRRRRPSPPAGQLPGGPRTGGGASHVADQHRPLSPLHRRGPRLRMARTARHRRSTHRSSTPCASSNFSADTSTTGTRPRAAPARPEVRVHRGQRQPGGPPPDAAGGVPRAGDRPLLGPQVLSGIGDTVLVLRESCALWTTAGRSPSRARISPRPSMPSSPRSSRRRSRPPTGHSPDDAREHRADTPRTSHVPCPPSVTTPSAARWWRGPPRSVQSSRATSRDLDTLLPWARRADPSEFAGGRARMLSPALAGDALDGRLPATVRAGHRRGRPIEAACADIARRLAVLRRVADGMASEMDFGFLFDPTRNLFSIGYRVAERRARRQLLRPPGVGGAAGQLHRDREGDVPPSHWFRLGRALTPSVEARPWCRGRDPCSST